MGGYGSRYSILNSMGQEQTRNENHVNGIREWRVDFVNDLPANNWRD